MIIYALICLLTLFGLFAGTVTGNIVPDTPDGKMTFAHIGLWLVVSAAWPVIYVALICSLIYDFIHDHNK